MTIEQIQKLIVDVQNFPKPGIIFKDITPIFQNHKAFKSLANILASKVNENTTQLVAIESRGFILASAMAQYLTCGVVLVRKPGKLPRQTVKESYLLEYGSDTLEIHSDALGPQDNVTIIDDVLATGGTAAAVEKLCEKLGATVKQNLFLMEIKSLEGRLKLKNPVDALLS